MKPLTLIGILMILGGAAALAMGVFTVKETDTVFKIGDLEATKTEEKHFPLKPTGIVLLGVGIVLVVVGATRKG